MEPLDFRAAPCYSSPMRRDPAHLSAHVLVPLATSSNSAQVCSGLVLAGRGA